MNLMVYDNFGSLPNNNRMPSLSPVFASEQYANYLKEVKGSRVIWFRIETKEGIEYVIPLGIQQKGPFKKGTFLTSVISLGNLDSMKMEKYFLNEIIKYIRQNKLCDWIQQSPNWAIFKTFPDEAIYTPFGTYKIGLEEKSIEQLFSAIHRDKRRYIRRALENDKYELKRIEDCIHESVEIINSTLMEAKIGSFTLKKFNEIKKYLNDNVLGYTIFYEGKVQSCIIYFLNSYAVYGMFAGSVKNAAQGSTLLVLWKVIQEAKNRNIKFIDLVGARINPDKDSKQYRIQRNKAHIGATLYEGYIWKMAINKPKYNMYRAYGRIMNFIKSKNNKGDIIDQEIQRLGKN